jgi:hypothetical protein
MELLPLPGPQPVAPNLGVTVSARADYHRASQDRRHWRFDTRPCCRFVAGACCLCPPQHKRGTMSDLAPSKRFLMHQSVENAIDLYTPQKSLCPHFDQYASACQDAVRKCSPPTPQSVLNMLIPLTQFMEWCHQEGCPSTSKRRLGRSMSTGLAGSACRVSATKAEQPAWVRCEESAVELFLSGGRTRPRCFGP